MTTHEPRLMDAAACVVVLTLLSRREHSSLASKESMMDLAVRIKDVEAMEIADAGHLVSVDQAAAFDALLLDFRERRLPRVAP